MRKELARGNTRQRPICAVPGDDCDFDEALFIRIGPVKLILALPNAQRLSPDLRAALQRAKER